MKYNAKDSLRLWCFQNAVSVLYKNSTSSVMVDSEMPSEFSVTIGVLQRDTLAHFLFVVVLDYLFKQSRPEVHGFLVPRKSKHIQEVRLGGMNFLIDYILVLENNMQIYGGVKQGAFWTLERIWESTADIKLKVSLFKVSADIESLGHT